MGKHVSRRLRTLPARHPVGGTGALDRAHRVVNGVGSPASAAEGLQAAVEAGAERWAFAQPRQNDGGSQREEGRAS